MTEQPSKSAKKKPGRMRRWAKIAALVIGALVLLVILASSGLMLWGSRRIRREIEAVKTLNEPTNWDELLQTDRQGHVVLAADDPAGKEAASLYSQALAQAKAWGNALPQEFRAKLNKDALSAEEIQQLGDALSPHQEAIGLLYKAAQYDGIVNLPEASIEPGQQQADEITLMREAARLLSAQAYYSAIQGRGDDAADICIVMLRYARSFPGYNEMTGLLHLALVGLACRTIERTQMLTPCSVEKLDALRAALEQRMDDTFLTRAFCGERVCYNYFLQSDLVKFPRFSLWPNQAAYLELLREAVAASREPFPASLRMSRQIRSEYARPVGPRYTFCIFAAMNASIFDVMLSHGAEAQARIRATLVSLAIRRARFAGASMPTALIELVPKYLSAVPIDPFTGEPLRYRVDDTGCSIYSVGPDGVDNGGTARAVTGSGGGPEQDIVVHLPR